MKMETIEGSETSASRIRTPENSPKEYIIIIIIIIMQCSASTHITRMKTRILPNSKMYLHRHTESFILFPPYVKR
jgi:hypothetical protein